MSSGSTTTFFRRSIIWQMIFILTILYAVSSINVLVIAMSILPYFNAAFFRLNILVYFADISFGLAAFFSIYHLTTMFRNKKRKMDKQKDEQRMGFVEIFRRTIPMMKIIFVIIVLYLLISLYVLLWVLGVAGNVFTSNQIGTATDVDNLWISFAIVSFGLAIIISAFHLSTMILRRKRKTDKIADNMAAA